MLRFFILFVGLILSSLVTAQDAIAYDFELHELEIDRKHNNDSTLTTLLNKKGITLDGAYRIIQKDSSVHYTMIQNGLQDGLYSTFYKSGELESEETYELGIKKGTGNWYYKNGEKKRTIPFKNNSKHGPCIWYYRSGQPLKECTYKDGKEEGVCKWYFAKGNLKWLVTYERGVKNGNVQKYKNSGTQEFNGFFLNDIQVSKAVFEKAQLKQ